MKNLSSADFYQDALLNVLYPAGVLFLARNIQRDKSLSDFDRSYLMRLARDLYWRYSRLDLFFDL